LIFGLVGSIDCSNIVTFHFQIKKTGKTLPVFILIFLVTT
jgi:hypothetical protein